MILAGAGGHPRRRAALFLVAAAVLLEGAAGAAAGPAKEPSRPAEERLSLSLPEVVIESPSLERLIAARVRPTPPARLGVRLPDLLVRPEAVSIGMPARPLPPEKAPDPDLARFAGRFARLFGDEKKFFETGLAYLKADSPVEALSFLEKAAQVKDNPGLRAAALFWAAEALIRLDRPGEAARRRKQVLTLIGKPAARYAAAARYALAEGRCAAKDFQGCLGLLDRGAWPAGGFASGEARFLQAWALARLGSMGRALDSWRALGAAGGPLALRALVAAGHAHFTQGAYAKALKAYRAAEGIGPGGKAGGEGLLGEALHGIGWSRLMLGRFREAGVAFALFLRRHPRHPLRRSAGMGALVVRFETAPAGPGLAESLAVREEAYFRRYPSAPQEGALRLQLAWSLFRRGDYPGAARAAAAVSDAFPLGRVYRIARIIEGLSRYHLGEIRRAYGILRQGADRPPADPALLAERSAARSAAMATAFAAFRIKDFSGVEAVLAHWAFGPKGAKRGEGGRGEGRTADPEAALWYAEAAFEAGDLKGAERAFRSIPEKAPQAYRARAGLAWIRYRRRQWKAAAAAFDAVFAADPRGALAAEALARAGEARFNLGDYAGALRAFKRVEKKYADSDVGREALFQKGKLLFRRNRLAEAEAAFDDYLRRFAKGPAADEAAFLRALIPFHRGDFPAARARLLAFVERRRDAPLAAEAYLRLGDTAYNAGRYTEADRLYRLMMVRFPGHPKRREAAYGLVLTRLQREDYPAFLREARRFIEAYPDDGLSVTLAFQVGEVYLTRGDLDGAFRAYRDVTVRYPADELAAQALLRISEIHRRKNDIDAALDAYQKLLAAYPKSPLAADAMFGAGETLAKIGRCAEARVSLERFLKTFPGHDFEILARYELGRCLIRLGDEDAAAVHLRAAVAGGGGLGDALRSNAALLLAAVLTRKGAYDEAEWAIGRAMASGDEAVAAEALYSRAELRARRGDARARSDFLKLTYRYPGQKMWVVRALSRAGELYEAAGSRTTALRIFQKMKEVAPPGQWRNRATEAVERLSARPVRRP